jgi:hypothetical protein
MDHARGGAPRACVAAPRAAPAGSVAASKNAVVSSAERLAGALHAPPPLPPPPYAPRRRSVPVSYDWAGVRASGSVQLDGITSAAQLLEALVELGEALIGPHVSAARSQVCFVAPDGATRKMYVTKTRWAELRDCQRLVVQKLP